jgi:hypothetical protein
MGAYAKNAALEWTKLGTALPPIADIRRCGLDVRKVPVPVADITAARDSVCLVPTVTS